MTTKKRLPVAIAAAALILSACSQDKEKPTPAPLQATSAPASGTPSYTPGPSASPYDFGLTEVGQYRVEATGPMGPYRLTITVGKPVPVAEYSKHHKVACDFTWPNLTEIIPLHMQRQNLSATPQPTNATMKVAVAPAHVSPQFSLALGYAKNCSSFAPLKGTQTTTVSNLPYGAKIQPADRTLTKDEVGQARFFIAVQSAPNNPRVKVDGLFIRLTVDPGYRVTRFVSVVGDQTSVKAGMGGVLTTGPDKGAFYGSLQPGTNPCAILPRNAGVILECASALTSP